MYRDEVTEKATDLGWQIDETNGRFSVGTIGQGTLRGGMLAGPEDRARRVALIDLYREWRTAHPVPTPKDIASLKGRAKALIGGNYDNLDFLEIIDTRYPASS